VIVVHLSIRTTIAVATLFLSLRESNRDVRIQVRNWRAVTILLGAMRIQAVFLSVGESCAAATTWTAPSTEGEIVITITVSDGHGGTVTVTVTIDVSFSFGVGEADVNVKFRP
jgi:hypothetical protein